MARPEYDLVVIGGGAAGLVVAAGGATLGAKVALVERGRLGGDCLWHGCVPSKALIKSAQIAHTMRHAQRWGLEPTDPGSQLPRVMAHVAHVVERIAVHDSPERFRSLGVEVIEGSGRFVDRDAFEVNARRMTARHFVVATGSRPTIPAIPGLAGTRYLTNETIFDLRESVPRLIVIGAGPLGCEFAQAFRRLGSEVDVVDTAPRILTEEDDDLAGVVQAQMQDDGVRLHLAGEGLRIEDASGAMRVSLVAGATPRSTLDGSHLLLATGRTPNLDGLALDAAGVAFVDGAVALNGLRTSNPRIFLAGDVAGGRYTHAAEHHAGIVLRQTIFRQRWSRPSTIMPRCTFTDPEVAQVGVTERHAQRGGIDHRIHAFPFDRVDRAVTDGTTAGFAKVIADRRGRILGAGIVGPHAGDLIALFALAMERRLPLSAVAATIHPYPTLAQINRKVADERRRSQLTPAMKRLVRRLFRLRGA